MSTDLEFRRRWHQAFGEGDSPVRVLEFGLYQIYVRGCWITVELEDMLDTEALIAKVKTVLREVLA